MNLKQHIRSINETGYTVVRGLLSQEQIAAIRLALKPWLQKQLMGRNDFEGFKSERVYALLAKSPIFSTIVAHQDVLTIVDHFLDADYLLSSNLAINLHPGETVQRFHADHTDVPNCERTIVNGISTVWAFDDFTEDNGATEVIPGSHLWPAKQTISNHKAEKVLMSAGSVMIFHGSLYHRGGANSSQGTRLAITPQYCQPWLRQLENMTLVVPPAAASQLPERVQELLGYSIRAPGFTGFVDGKHPKRLFDEFYRGRKYKEIE